MLEIIALIFLSKKIGNLAEQKGQKRWVWQFYTVIAWFTAEVFGIVFSLFLFKTEQVMALLPLAYGFAIGSYFLLRSILAKKPDILETSFEFEKQSSQ